MHIIINFPPAGDYNYWHRPVYMFTDVQSAGLHPSLMEPPKLLVEVEMDVGKGFPLAD